MSFILTQERNGIVNVQNIANIRYVDSYKGKPAIIADMTNGYIKVLGEYSMIELAQRAFSAIITDITEGKPIIRVWIEQDAKEKIGFYYQLFDMGYRRDKRIEWDKIFGTLCKVYYTMCEGNKEKALFKSEKTPSDEDLKELKKAGYKVSSKGDNCYEISWRSDL